MNVFNFFLNCVLIQKRYLLPYFYILCFFEFTDPSGQHWSRRNEKKIDELNRSSS